VTWGRGDKETVPGQGDCSRTWRHGDGTEVERWLLSFSPNQVETRERQGDTGKGDNETVPGQGDCSRTRRLFQDMETRRRGDKAKKRKSYLKFTPPGTQPERRRCSITITVGGALRGTHGGEG